MSLVEVIDVPREELQVIKNESNETVGDWLMNNFGEQIERIVENRKKSKELNRECKELEQQIAWSEFLRENHIF